MAMVRLTRKERQDKVNLLASINKVNIGDEVEATDNGKWSKQFIHLIYFLSSVIVCHVLFIIFLLVFYSKIIDHTEIFIIFAINKINVFEHK